MPCASHEKSLWSQADEPCYEEETVGDDEGTVGGEKEGGVEPYERRLKGYAAIGYVIEQETFSP